MYVKILKYLTNLLFKPYFSGFFPGRKKRKPGGIATCHVCYLTFASFNKRQKICSRKDCIKVYRARQYRTMLERKRLEANKASVSLRTPSDLESEE